jgi:hypothetical protein
MASYSWTGIGRRGLFSDPHNWNPVGVPAQGDDASISNGDTVEIRGLK